MSRKNALMLIGVVLLLVIGAILFFFFWYDKEPKGEPGGGTFPSTDDTETPPEEEGGPVALPDTKAPRLRLLSKEPTAGSVIGKRGGSLVARFVEVATGNIFEADLAEGEPERLTNTTIPKVYEALWKNSGTGVILRYLKDGESVESFSGTIKGEASGGERELAGSFLPKDIVSLSLSPDGKEVFYLRRESDQSVGTISDLAGANRREVWRSPLREWSVLWFKSDRVALLSRPSGLAPGMLLYLNPSTGATERVLSGESGFSALPSPTGAFVAFSEWGEDTGVRFSLFEKTSRDTRTLSTRTFPEKCAWNKKGAVLYCAVPKSLPVGVYPDAWYQGLVGFSDDIWVTDVIRGTTHILANLQVEGGVDLDVMNLSISEDESYLVFADNNTQTLWSLRVEP